VQVLTRMREENLPVGNIAADAQQRLEQFRQHWQALPEAVRRNGSVPESVAHALARLYALNQRYFLVPSSVAPPPAAAPEAATLPAPEPEAGE
jgi:hypothetical protein